MSTKFTRLYCAIGPFLVGPTPMRLTAAGLRYTDEDRLLARRRLIWRR